MAVRKTPRAEALNPKAVPFEPRASSSNAPPQPFDHGPLPFRPKPASMRPDARSTTTSALKPEPFSPDPASAQSHPMAQSSDSQSSAQSVSEHDSQSSSTLLNSGVHWPILSFLPLKAPARPSPSKSNTNGLVQNHQAQAAGVEMPRSPESALSRPQDDLAFNDLSTIAQVHDADLRAAVLLELHRIKNEAASSLTADRVVHHFMAQRDCSDLTVGQVRQQLLAQDVLDLLLEHLFAGSLVALEAYQSLVADMQKHAATIGMTATQLEHHNQDLVSTRNQPPSESRHGKAESEPEPEPQPKPQTQPHMDPRQSSEPIDQLGTERSAPPAEHTGATPTLVNTPSISNDSQTLDVSVTQDAAHIANGSQMARAPHICLSTTCRSPDDEFQHHRQRMLDLVAEFEEQYQAQASHLEATTTPSPPSSPLFLHNLAVNF